MGRKIVVVFLVGKIDFFIFSSEIKLQKGVQWYNCCCTVACSSFLFNKKRGKGLLKEQICHFLVIMNVYLVYVWV